jgi:hypothetical protein
MTEDQLRSKALGDDQVEEVKEGKEAAEGDVGAMVGKISIVPITP